MDFGGKNLRSSVVLFFLKKGSLNGLYGNTLERKKKKKMTAKRLYFCKSISLLFKKKNI